VEVHFCINHYHRHLFAKPQVGLNKTHKNSWQDTPGSKEWFLLYTDVVMGQVPIQLLKIVLKCIQTLYYNTKKSEKFMGKRHSHLSRPTPPHTPSLKYPLALYYRPIIILLSTPRLRLVLTNTLLHQFLK